MTSKDPLEQAEEVLHDMQRQIAAETIRAHAEMVLLSALMKKPVVQASLLFKASGQDIEYMSGMLVAVGLTARNWGRLLADNPNLDFTQYMVDGEECGHDGDFAHHLVREILLIEDVPHADKLREEMADFKEANSALDWGRAVTHLVGLYAELMEAVLEIRNGDHRSGEGDDR